VTSGRRSPSAIFCTLTSLLCAVFIALPARAGDPNLDWYTVESPHFRVHYHGGLETMAQRTATLAEAIRDRLTGPLANRPSEIVHILLTDTTDSANGSATIVPYDAIRLFVTAPEDLSTLGDYDDWLTGLVTHESAHVHHIDNIHGFPIVLNAIFGKIYAPNQVQPSWIREGIAVAMESLLTSGGRVRSSIFDMYLRADVLEDNFATLDQMSQDVRRWPGGDIAYLYGGKFMAWIVDTYGRDVLGAVATDYGANLVPWGINRSIRRATGYTYLELYDAWHASIRSSYSARADAIRKRGLRVGIRLTHSGYVAASPRWVPPLAREGIREEILYYRDDSHSPAGLYKLPLNSRWEADEDGASFVARTGGSPRVGSFDPEGGLVFDSIAVSARRRSFDELHHLKAHETSTTGRLATRERWTTGSRSRAPDVSPDGRRVTFITNHAGTMTPKIADILPEGGIANERRLVATGLWEQSFTPRFSPDGKRVAYSSWAPGGYRDVRIVDVETNAVFDVTRDRAMDVEPSWTPDGRYLVWSSDRTGVPNIYAYDLRSKKTWQVTNVLFGAFMPEVSPDGRTLVYVGYTSAGYDLFSLAFDERGFLEAPPPENTHPEPLPELQPRRWPVTPYDPLPTIRPRNFSFDYTPTSLGQAWTIAVRGTDIVGNHTFSAALRRYVSIGEFTGSIAYGYLRLPVDLRIAASRALAAKKVSINGVSGVAQEETFGVTSSVNYSIPGSFDNAAVSLSYSATTNARKYPDDLGCPGGLPLPSQPLPSASCLDPYNSDVPTAGRQFLGIVRTAASYANTQRSTWAISTERGYFGSFTAEHAGLATGSDATLLRFEGRVGGYLLAPWLRHHVFALQLSGGAASGSTTFRDFATGGYTTQGFEDTLFAFVGDLNQSPIVLRGYPPAAFGGNQYNLLNFEYRFPIAMIDRGISTLPLFFNYVSGTLFVDYGGAFDNLDLKDPWSSYHAGMGGQLHFEFTLGYFLDAGLTLGWARALDRKSIPNNDASQTYLVVSGNF
jgi:hypothetical protein